MSKTRTSLIISDPHFPIVDRRAYNLMLEVACAVPKIYEVVLLGDFADCYGVSAWGKDPAIEFKLIDEVNSVNEGLDELDLLFPKAKKVYLYGNHEKRLERFIEKKAPELFGITNIASLFKLVERKYKIVPYGPMQLYSVGGGDLKARHSPIGGYLHAAHNTIVKAGCSMIMGCGHRILESQAVTIAGEIHRGIMTGWLGDGTHSVMQYTKGHQQWSKGFSITETLPDGNFFNQLVHIIDNKCLYNGKIYKG